MNESQKLFGESKKGDTRVCFERFHLYEALEKTQEVDEQLPGMIGKEQRKPSGVIEMDYVLNVVVVTWEYKLIKTHQTVHLKWAHFTVCKLCFNKTYLKRTLFKSSNGLFHMH